MIFNLIKFRSNIDNMMNQRVLFLFFILVALALISAVSAEIYQRYFLKNAWYIGESLNNINFGWSLMTFFILYNNLIPISLQVTMEVVHFFQAAYINSVIIYILLLIRLLKN